MKRMFKQLPVVIHSFLCAFMIGALGLSQSARAADLDLADIPLFLNKAVSPNVFFEFDDSGSMDWDVLTVPFWHYCAYDNQGYGNTGNSDCRTSMENQGRWRGYARRNNTSASDRDFVYLFDSGDDAYSNNNCRGGNYYYNRTLERCDFTSETVQADWRIFSSSLNVMYYNPAIEYTPWKGECSNGVMCADADFASALSNPRDGEDGYTITRNLLDLPYSVWEDDKGFDGDRPRRGTNFNANNTPNGLVDLWDTHKTFVFGANSIRMTETSYAPDPTRPNDGLNPTVVQNLNLAGTNCHNELGGGDITCRTVAQAKQNFANWYQYYRRRMYIVKVAVSDILDSKPYYRFGASAINKWNGNDSIFHEVPPASAPSHAPYNRSLLERLYSFDQPALGTPLRRGLERAGDYYDATISQKDDPIVFECQKNFTILFTDGYYNGSAPARSKISDEDNDGVESTVADIAMYYYEKDLSPLPNRVPPDQFDTAEHQHMVTFTAALGVFGELVDLNNDGWPNVDDDNTRTLNEPGQAVDVESGNVLDETPIGRWGDASNDPEKIDDLWHAAFNSKGRFTAAGNPQELVEDLVEAISNIQSRLSSASAVALNSSTLNANSQVFQAKFDSTDWTGRLESFLVSNGSNCGTTPIGEICRSLWEASEILRGVNSDSRRIYTVDPVKPIGAQGMPFTWANLSIIQKAALNTEPYTGTPDTRGSDRLDYIRGNGDLEEDQTNGIFRVRNGNKLGDIINSSPIFVGKPTRHYSDSMESAKYSDFKLAKKNRTKMIYIGSNDGMLHAFDAEFGNEQYAYIPSVFIPELNQLTAPNYQHRFFVNGQSSVGDAFVGGEWGTYLNSGFGAGGQGLFVLNITDPDSLNQDTLLWEIRDDSPSIPANAFADMGYMIGRAHIVKMNNARWALIFGNGYNSTEADGTVGSGNAVLYIVDLETGGLIKKIDTGVGPAQDPLGANRPNGLAEPTAIDRNSDNIVDFIYAGDLFGNVWKFDVRSSGTASWGLAFDGNKPLFTATTLESGYTWHQPITGAITVTPHPANDFHSLVLFGTGKYMENRDKIVDAQEPTQTFYAIYDKHLDNGGDIDKDTLVEQVIFSEEVQNGLEYRRTSHPDDGSAYRVDWDTHNGWMMNLVSQDSTSAPKNRGERMFTKPLIRGQRVIFVTLLPSENPCGFGGDSWIMELDYKTGGRLSISPFDVDRDGHIDGDDIIGSISGGSQPPTYGGAKIEGMAAPPAIFNNPGGDGEYKMSSSSSGEIETWLESVDEDPYKRTAWRQLR